MMRVPINLASEPFRRDRPVLVASLAGCALLTVLLLILASTILSGRSRAAEARTAVNSFSHQFDSLTAEQAKLESTLRQPVNAEVLERSVLLNTLIARKSISWTRIFSDLDQVMPHNVRLIYVRLPQITANNQVTLDMVVGAEGPGPVVDFLKRLEGSPLFGPTSMSTFQPPSLNEPLWRYRITVSYAQKL